MRIKGKQFGIVLTETLVAVGMIAVGTLIMSNIMTSSAKTAKLSKDYLIAQNLTTEAVELVKNIRSTNWLIASDNKACWLRIDPSQDCAAPSINAESGNDYIVEFLNGKWSLVEVTGGSLDLKNDKIDNGSYQIFTGSELAYQDSGGDPTPYYRSLKFSNIDDLSNEFATLDVLVQWKDGAKVRETKQSVVLYN